MKLTSRQIFLDEIREEITTALLQYIESPANLNHKADGSPVTALDQNISDLIKQKIPQLDSRLNYYSEEDFSVFKKPMLIVDPIDGTRELLDGMPEFAVSVACLNHEKINHKSNWGWIYNPLTGEESLEKMAKKKAEKTGLISRSEVESGLFSDGLIKALNLRAVGSIAYKLLLLYHQQTDYVISLRPKNIWDIAAGTILCQQNGFDFYSENKKIKIFDQVHYQAPLIWCRAGEFNRIRKIIS
ncbi:MAG: hypothetical protein JNM93_10225 [Bacteriovoracaceae bacterium]|nr:hypothetical protein [Bacteriovoracaceae bacterium]